jgi:hypothetical protein
VPIVQLEPRLVVHPSAGEGGRVEIFAAGAAGGDHRPAPRICTGFGARFSSGGRVMDIEGRIEDLAKKAALADTLEGGHRVGANVMAQLAWALGFNAEHASCGKLGLETSPEGYAVAATCPVHGSSQAPEWVEP